MIFLVACQLLSLTLIVFLLRRLFQYDSVLEKISSLIFDYGSDLEDMARDESSETLAEHPELLLFIRRNRKAIRDMAKVYEDLVIYDPARRGNNNPLPRPDVE